MRVQLTGTVLTSQEQSLKFDPQHRFKEEKKKAQKETG
jgi:hypothetical protein